eukprot:sb/3472095/
MPMESSRIESDVSSEAENTKMLLGFQPLGFQPLDISEIRPQDNTQKLRTNNYLDISCVTPESNSGVVKISSAPSNCNSPASSSLCPTMGQQSSKDSGFGTSSAMTTMGATLPPLSEMSNILAAESRPLKRRKCSVSPDHDESGFQPPPVKRVVVAEPETGRITARRKHKSME